MKFEIKNRFTGAVQITAEIDCDNSTALSWKLRLAVIWAVKNSADLRSANLSYANLRSADLSYANLSSANLRSADLSYANLRSADLSYANLSSADLRSANLRSANLSYANLRSANLSYANLSSANLSYADLRYANLSSADLRYANLSSANLSSANLRRVAAGNCKEIKTVQSSTYSITISSDRIAIGCEQHTIKQWWRFTKKEISAMDSGALEWWVKWKPILKTIIDAEL